MQKNGFSRRIIKPIKSKKITWLLSGLQEHNLTLAPKATSVSTRTAVCIVTLIQTPIRAPARIWHGSYFSLEQWKARVNEWLLGPLWVLLQIDLFNQQIYVHCVAQKFGIKPLTAVRMLPRHATIRSGFGVVSRINALTLDTWVLAFHFQRFQLSSVPTLPNWYPPLCMLAPSTKVFFVNGYKLQ